MADRPAILLVDDGLYAFTRALTLTDFSLIGH
jgi:hypothetical protein